MQAVVRSEAKQLAQLMGWAEDFTEGFVEGDACRCQGCTPPSELMRGDSNYAVGVQIGYSYGEAYLMWATQ